MTSTATLPRYLSARKDSYNTDVHFKWDSIRTFIYIAFSYSSYTNTNELFTTLKDEVRIYDYLLLEITIGMTYLCMDFFIKQYTRRVDFNTYLNPLLKGILFGSILQSAMRTISNGIDLTDFIHYLIVSVRRPPSWSLCTKSMNSSKVCMSPEDIVSRCPYSKTLMNITSVHSYYKSSFTQVDRSTLTTRCFLLAIIWISNFFICTVSDNILVRMMKLVFFYTMLSTTLSLGFLIIDQPAHRYTALFQLLNISTPSTFESAMSHVAQTYTIGFIGIHDFSSMSPYTMIDNAVVIFTIVHTLYAIGRAIMTRILVLILDECVKLSSDIKEIDYHYLSFAIIPLSMHFLPLENLYAIIFFSTSMILSGANIALITVTMAKMLHSEYKTIKIVYLIGLLCVFGFFLSLPILMGFLPLGNYEKSLSLGVKVTVLFLGSYRVACIMYIYGVHNLTTDIHFWLGFKPTKFWTFNWTLTPIVLFAFFIFRLMSLFKIPDSRSFYVALGWTLFTILVVLSFNIKIIIRYLQNNNVMGIFKAHPKFGPLDRNTLKKRKVYNETVRHQICKHNCIVFDENYDCHHNLRDLYDSHSTDSSESSDSTAYPKCKTTTSLKKVRMSCMKVSQ